MSDARDAVAPGPAVLAADHVSKRFGRVVALDDISLEVHARRVTCLLGDNGAGKSTLIRIVAGVDRPTSGRVLVDGEPVACESPRAALERGIATVHQDLALIPLMSVWRNFFLGREPTRGRGPFRRIDAARCRSIARDEVARLGVELDDPDRAVGTLSGGERQAVAIARAIHAGARALILDEPTASLGVRQAVLVLRTVVAARERGLAVLLITHSPHHAHAVGDRFVLLRRGRVTGDFHRGEVDLAGLVRAMAGGDELKDLTDSAETAGARPPVVRTADPPREP